MYADFEPIPQYAMMLPMRTALTINKLVTALKMSARKTGELFKKVVNKVLGASLTTGQSLPKAKPFKSKSFSMGSPLPGVNLVKANQLAGELEDEELLRKMQLGK